MTQYKSGVIGEKLAQDWLIRQGMVCLDRRFRAVNGEIDLIMQDGIYIVFVQVKYRPGSAAGSGLMAVGRDKQRRMCRAAMVWLLRHGGMNKPARFDVLQITRDGVRHIPNAFQYHP